jgi:hypothetical protein
MNQPGRRYKTLNEKAVMDLDMALRNYNIMDDTRKLYLRNAVNIPNLSAMNMQVLAGAYMYLQYSGQQDGGTFDEAAWRQLDNKNLPSTGRQSKEKIEEVIKTATYRYIRRIQSVSSTG